MDTAAPIPTNDGAMDTPPAAERLFAGPGEMRARCRALDWAATPLGPVERWPQSLRTAVDICLASHFPTALLWGPELVLIHNEAHIPVLGTRYPGAMGRPAREVLSDTWPVLGPHVRRTLEGAEDGRAGAPNPLDIAVTFDRGEGTRPGFLTVSISAVRDEASRPAGVLIAAVDVTARALAEEASKAREAFLLTLSDAIAPLGDAEAIRLTAARVLGRHLGASRVAYAEDCGDGRHFDVTRNYVDGAADASGRYRYADFGSDLLPELRAGRTRVQPDTRNDGRLTDAERQALLDHGVGASLNVPLVKEGRLVAFLGVSFLAAHEFTSHEIDLVREVAGRTWAAVERARAEAALRESETRTRFQAELLAGAAEAMVATDEHLVITYWNRAAEELLGWTAEEALGQPSGAVFRTTVPGSSREAVIARILEQGGYQGEVIYRHKEDDRAVWAEVRTAALRAPDGQFRGTVTAFHDVTERKRAEAALRESEARYRMLFDSIDEGFCVIEVLFEGERPVDYRFLETNPAFVQQTGLADAAGRRMRELAPAHEAHWFEIYGRIARTGEPTRFQAPAMALGNRWYDVYAFRIGEPGAHRVAILSTDVSERKRAEAALREREARQAFLLALSDAVRACPDERSITQLTVTRLGEHLRLDRCYVSEVFEDEGYSTVGPEHVRAGFPSMVGRYRLSDYPETQRQMATQPLVIDDADIDPRFSDGQKAMLALVPQRALLVAPLRKGPRQIVWALAGAMATPRRWTESERLLLGEVAERTWSAVERVRAEAALRESEGRYRTLFETMGQGYCELELLRDAQGRAVDQHYLVFNPAFERIFGIPVAQAQGRKASEVFPALEPWWNESFDRIARGGTPEYIEHEMVSLGRWFEVQVYPRGGDRLMVLYEDVTDRKRAEAVLRESEEQFRRSLEEAPIPVIMHAEDGEVLQISRTWTELTGYTIAEVPTFDAWLTRAYGHGADAVRAHVHALFSGSQRTMSIEFPVRTRDGDVRHWSFSASAPGTLYDGRRFVVGMALDVTERRRAEAALRELNELLERRVEARTAEVVRADQARREVLRQLVTAEEDERRRISRELHDSLGQLVTGLLLGLKALPRGADGQKARIEGLERLADRIASEMQHLAVELRPPALDNLGLRLALQAHMEEWSRRHGIECDFHAVGVDGERFAAEVETTLYRVLQEGLNNVVKHAGATRVSLVLERRNGMVGTILEDDGRGFDVEATLASPEKARRLGLRGMRERVALLGGELEIESAAGAGTTLYVRIPLPAGAAADKAEADEAEADEAEADEAEAEEA